MVTGGGHEGVGEEQAVDGRWSMANVPSRRSEWDRVGLVFYWNLAVAITAGPSPSPSRRSGSGSGRHPF